jgi:hypothetical protein
LRSKEGDVVIAFLKFLQQKKQKEEGDGNKAVVAFFFLLWSCEPSSSSCGAQRRFLWSYVTA